MRVEQGHSEVVGYLESVLESVGAAAAEARAELRSRGIAYTESAFLDAAWDGNLEVVELFVQAGMPVDAATEDGGFTALYAAAAGGRLEMVRYLVGQGADVNATHKGDWRFTALDVAAGLVICRLWSIWCEQGANIEARDVNDETVLHRAALRGHLSVVRYLVGRGRTLRRGMSTAGRFCTGRRRRVVWRL